MASPTTTFLLLLLCAPALSFSINPFQSRSPSLLWRRARSVPPEGFYDPTASGGKLLTVAPGTGGLGEPLNVIVSASSDEMVLVDTETGGGFRNYFIAVGFGSECLGQHLGTPQTANLGDGNGQKDETAVLRWDYGDPELGTCQETIKGGNHFRYWVQNGPSGNSGAYFLATSYELPIETGHDIAFNGYNNGRDWLVGNATAQTQLISGQNVTNGTTFSGQVSFGGYTYHTDAVYLSGFLSNSTEGVNHASKVGGDGTLAVDGMVAVLTIEVTSVPPSDNTSGAQPSLRWSSWALSTSVLFFASFALSLSV